MLVFSNFEFSNFVEFALDAIRSDLETGGCYKRIEGDEVLCSIGYPRSSSREG